MKTIRFIDRPVQVPRTLYEEAVDHIIGYGKSIPGLMSIYRFGNINVPGISDLDLLFIFRDGSSCPLNGLESLPDKFSRLFTHGIMAMSEAFFDDNFQFTIWSKAECVWGEQMPAPSQRTEEDDLALKKQTAVEFLMANYIDFTVQSTYRVFKLRSFLQHMKGIGYDMELLGINQSTLHPLLDRLRSMIDNWFIETPTDGQIRDWIASFSAVFTTLLDDILQHNRLTLPEGKRYKIASNMWLIPEPNVGFSHRGWLPPPLFAFMGRNYFKLLHRTNRFLFTCPVSHQSEGFLAQRFRFLQRMKAYNNEHLPGFMTMTPSINAKII